MTRILFVKTTSLGDVVQIERVAAWVRAGGTFFGGRTGLADLGRGSIRGGLGCRLGQGQRPLLSVALAQREVQ